MTPRVLGIIAGNGTYPFVLAKAARHAGVGRVVIAAFENETRPELAQLADRFEWLRVGQLGKMIRYFRAEGVDGAIMAGQIAPRNLFDLRPDLRALLLLGRLRERNAESIFGAIADELAGEGITLLPATTFLDDLVPTPGLVAGPELNRKRMLDVEFGYRIAREVSRLDIGQTVVVRRGTVLAVEAFEGTDECLRRGGALGRGAATMVKVSKPRQDFRFDVPVIGARTLLTAAESGISTIVIEAGRTLLLEKDETLRLSVEKSISLYAYSGPTEA